MAQNGATWLEIQAVTHRYGHVVALDGVSLEIGEGELVTLLGPSGCGKTTLLRILAGFTRPTEGRVVLQGKDITRVPPHKRPVNMVFQRATLFPHLDVAGNVSFGLRVAKVGRDEIGQRVSQALRLVRLEGFEARRAHELSGGQMQRVALARALVNRPRVLLLDEPLSALDLKIRLEMEEELRRLHRETGATFVYVTHDQREALSLSDRIVVFDHGRIEQLGTPDEIYRTPASPFAARFVGDANVLPVEVVGHGGGRAAVTLAGQSLSVPCDVPIAGGDAWLVLRPEAVRLTEADGTGLGGAVRDLAFRGSGFTYRVEVPGLSETLKAEVPAGAGHSYELGAAVAVRFDADTCVLLPRAALDSEKEREGA
jgi:ABC-type Fe3+/spermidine/putrescine transport system ATPase subunit